MPSKSYMDFLELLEDVHKLRQTHYNLNNGKKGKKGLGFLTRSATVMLCAAWERYNENLLLESIDLILATNLNAKSLSKYTLKYLSEKVRNNKIEIYPIELADLGWRNLWKGYAVNDTDQLNTPNSNNLDTLFKRHLGINEYSKTMWYENDIDKINNFIKIRGEIAHNGSKSRYIRFNQLNANIETIIENTIQIDYSISEYLKAEYNIRNTWRTNYYRKLSSYKK